jgi:hypothetical protein
MRSKDYGLWLKRTPPGPLVTIPGPVPEVWYWFRHPIRYQDVNHSTSWQLYFHGTNVGQVSQTPSLSTGWWVWYFEYWSNPDWLLTSTGISLNPLVKPPCQDFRVVMLWAWLIQFSKYPERGIYRRCREHIVNLLVYQCDSKDVATVAAWLTTEQSEVDALTKEIENARTYKGGVLPV